MRRIISIAFHGLSPAARRCMRCATRIGRVSGAREIGRQPRFVIRMKRPHNVPSARAACRVPELLQARMRLTTKGLLLIAIPTVFELTLLSGLVKAQVDAEQAEAWVLHSKDALRQTTAILRPKLVESVRGRGAVLNDARHAGAPLSLR